MGNCKTRTPDKDTSRYQYPSGVEIKMLALTLSSSAFVAPLTPAGRKGVAISMIGGRGGQANAGGNGKWEPAWKTKSYTGGDSLQPPVEVEADAPAAAPTAASEVSSTTVVQACMFMQDPALVGMSVEAKAKFLESKGVASYAIAQASCVSLGQFEAFGPVMYELYK